MTSDTITLTNFVEQYLRAAERRRSEEIYEDFHCNEIEEPMILRDSELERQASNVYTCTVFKLFQEELRGCLSMAIQEVANHGGTFMFKLSEEGNRYNFVEFNCLNLNVTCSCKKYESIGILCSHALKVLLKGNIVCIPSQYILKRWTKSAKEGMVVDYHRQEIGDESLGELSSFTGRLTHKALNVISRSVAVEENREIVENYLDKALKEVENVLKTKMAGHLNGKDAAIRHRNGDSIGIDCLEAQSKVLNPPCSSQEELSKHSIEVAFKRKVENKVSQTERKPCDNAIIHGRLLKEARKDGYDQGSRARSGSALSVGENSLKQPEMPTENMQEAVQRLEQEISKLKEKFGEPSVNQM